MSEENWSVGGYDRVVLENGRYDATIRTLKKKPSQYGDEYVQWFFHPDGYDDDVLVVGSTSLAQGPTAKPMEWARRVTGKSDATDMKWGKDLKGTKRPIVNWGPQEMAGKRCQIVVEKYYDEDEEVDRCRVVNVLPPRQLQPVAAESDADPEADFEDIPF